MAEFEIKRAQNGEFYWVFKSGGEVVCVTETYKSKQSAKHSINVVKEKAKDAKIDDTTD